MWFPRRHRIICTTFVFAFFVSLWLCESAQALWARINSISTNDFRGSDLIYDCTDAILASFPRTITMHTWLDVDVLLYDTFGGSVYRKLFSSSAWSVCLMPLVCCCWCFLLDDDDDERWLWATVVDAIKFAFCTSFTAIFWTHTNSQTHAQQQIRYMPAARGWMKRNIWVRSNIRRANVPICEFN